MFSKHGWLVLIWGILFLPVGFGIQVIAKRLLNFFPEEMRILCLLPIPHLPSFFRQIADADHITAPHDEQPFNRVFKFTYISGP